MGHRSMTRQNYVVIANALERTFALARAREDGALMVAARKVADDLCNALQYDNPRFDRDRFLDACGMLSRPAQHS